MTKYHRVTKLFEGSYERSQKNKITETLLEFVQLDDGKLILRESRNKDEVLVSIDFSQKVKDMLGEDTQYIGEHMIQAAMMAVMNRQMSHYHAYVYDEEPTHYS